MDFSTKLKNYAQLLVRHGLNVQKGQTVNIRAEVYQRDFAALVAEEAYKAGAKMVMLDFLEPRLKRARILHSSEEDLSYVPSFIEVKYREMVDSCGANLAIVGEEFPEMLADLETRKVNTERVAVYKALQYFYENGIGRSQVHWTVAAAATPAWGKKLFPNAQAEEACSLLWEEIFKICRVTTPDFLEVWHKHNDVLRERALKLTALKIDELHFVGPGTDLRVGLSSRAVFRGGSDKSPRGVLFEPNIPTEECFTTPDYRRTTGVARTTRPFLINGKMIRDLVVEFTAGEISKFSAREGEETFREYMNSDSGGKRLGEVALVGIDSPVFKSGHVFEEILFDENAACHIAIGSAYKFCLEGGEKMPKAELEAIGCNESSVHTDMMISSPEVDVEATLANGTKVLLIRKGEWQKF